MEELEHIAKKLVAQGKGLLAADESEKSCQKRFDSVGVECTDETRREYRNLLFSTPQAADFLNGVILFDETFHQRAVTDQPIPAYLKERGIIPGIKVDEGLVPFHESEQEKVTEGLEGLPERMHEYHSGGARFAKWRAVITIGPGTPTDADIEENADILARYSLICQQAGIVPIVEPEVLFDGDHTIERCEEVIERVYDILFQELKAHKVFIPGTILKTSFVLPGKDSGTPIDSEDVATRTVRALHEHIPHDLGGVVFLSGGETSKDSFINLNRVARKGPHPWGVTFSYSRALQDPVLKFWAKNRDKTEAIYDLFAKQLRLASAASKGELNEEELDADTFVSHSQD